MPEDTILKSFDTPKEASFVKSVLLPALIILLIIFAGGGTGYLLSSGKIEAPASVVGNYSLSIKGSTAKEAGVNNPTAYKDKSEGRIEVNDNEAVPEGSHKLIRPGGDSKTAYIVSSVLDLNQFVGQCVEVYGQTYSAQKAGWFMDVGYLKVLDLCPSGI